MFTQLASVSGTKKTLTVSTRNSAVLKTAINVLALPCKKLVLIMDPAVSSLFSQKLHDLVCQTLRNILKLETLKINFHHFASSLHWSTDFRSCYVLRIYHMGKKNCFRCFFKTFHVPMSLSNSKSSHIDSTNIHLVLFDMSL